MKNEPGKTYLCPCCWAAHKAGGWYMSSDYVQVPDVADCTLHPDLSSWRVVRTLKSIRHWSMQPGEYRHPNFQGVRLVLEGGHVHRRTAEAILFDYEKPYLDLLVAEGYLDAHDGTPRTLTVTEKGELRVHAALQEAMEKEQAKLAAKRAGGAA